MVANKYQAKHVYWNLDKQIVESWQNVSRYRKNGKLYLPKHLTRFDSQHEFKVYLELCRMYGDSKVSRQVAEEIIPESFCYPKGKKWKIDFAVEYSKWGWSATHWIEAKGAITSEFINNLAWLEHFAEHVFCHLYIIFPNKLPTTNKIINNLINVGWERNIFTLYELKQLDRLP